MEPSQEQLQQIKKLWNLDNREIRFIRRVENFVYEAELSGRSVILRLTEPEHRSKEQLASELHWLDYLSQKGMRLASPIRSCRDSFVEILSGEPIFFVSVFEKAPGQSLQKSGEFSTSILKKWGQYLGKMQKLTLGYQRAPHLEPRPSWEKDSNFQVVLKGLDQKNKVPYEQFYLFMEWLKTLPRNKESFGLVHCDLHYGNFFVENQEITVFDFDDCCYHWFIYDMVTPLFHLQQKRDQGDLKINYKKLEEAYLQGYLDQFPLGQEWLDRMDLFSKFRINTVYHWAKASMADGKLAGNPSAQTWCQKLFVWAEEKFQEKLEFR